MKNRIRYLSHTVSAIEQKIITGLYFEENPSVERVCEACAMEKSSVYRYRARALEKLTFALFGE